VSPLYDLMKAQALSSKVVQTDDTPVPVLDPELPHTRTGRIWTYVGDAVHPYTGVRLHARSRRNRNRRPLADNRGSLIRTVPAAIGVSIREHAAKYRNGGLSKESLVARRTH
jgi:hypothetical protein